MEKGSQIVSDFILALSKTACLKINRSPVSQNVFQVSGEINTLLYVKGRAEAPYRWGVTANVINRLKKQGANWFVVLLFESEHQGYFLKSSDVEHYINNIWPLGNDGDYKPSSGRYLANNRPFKSFDHFLSLLIDRSC